jgi:hypothetical protein
MSGKGIASPLATLSARHGRLPERGRCPDDMTGAPIEQHPNLLAPGLGQHTALQFVNIVDLYSIHRLFRL